MDSPISIYFDSNVFCFLLVKLKFVVKTFYCTNTKNNFVSIN